MRCASAKKLPFLVKAMLFRGICLVYIPFMAMWETLESFVTTIWLITAGLAWDSAQMFVLRASMTDIPGFEESTWSFGQMLPVLLLLSPAVSAVEHLYDGK